jgi:tetratricopeptide (TPR) repeat protein
MARRLVPSIQKNLAVSVKRLPPPSVRLCAQKELLRGTAPLQIHQIRNHTTSLPGKSSATASITTVVRQGNTTPQTRLIILIASVSALLFWNALGPPPIKARFDGHGFGADDPLSKVNRLLRRATFYADKGDHAEVYEAMQLALQECDRLGLRTDEPFVLRIYQDSARALFKQGLHEEALETLQHIPELCTVALQDLDKKGIDADEVYQIYLDRSSEIAPDMTLEEYEAFQWGRMSWFKLLIESEIMRAQILSAGGNEEESIKVVISVVVAIEGEMKHDYSRAPDFPDPNGSLSKKEILSILELLRGVLLWRDIDRALPFSQRVLALMQSTEDARKTCAVVEAMRWLAINLSGAGADLELRERSRTAKVSQFYSEARQWAEQALDMSASIKASGDSGDHPLTGPSGLDEPILCNANCVAILNLLAGMSIFIDKDEKEGRRLLEEGLRLAKPLGAHAQIENAEGFLRDLDAGTVGSEETLIRDGELFGYTQRLGRERRKERSEADDKHRGKER